MFPCPDDLFNFPVVFLSGKKARSGVEQSPEIKLTLVTYLKHLGQVIQKALRRWTQYNFLERNRKTTYFPTKKVYGLVLLLPTIMPSLHYVDHDLQIVVYGSLGESITYNVFN